MLWKCSQTLSFPCYCETCLIVIITRGMSLEMLATSYCWTTMKMLVMPTWGSFFYLELSIMERNMSCFYSLFVVLDDSLPLDCVQLVFKALETSQFARVLIWISFYPGQPICGLPFLMDGFLACVLVLFIFPGSSPFIFLVSST